MPISTNKSIIISTNQEIVDKINDALIDTNYGTGISTVKSFEDLNTEVELILFHTSTLNEVFFEQLRNLNKTWTIVPIIVIAPNIDFQEGEFIIKNGGLFYFEEGEIRKQNLLKIFHAATNFKKIGKNWETAFGYTKEKESNLRTVLNNVEDAIILLDKEFHILDFNKPSLRFFEAMLGGFPQINSSFLDIATDPTEKAFWEKNLQNILLDTKRSIERSTSNSITYKITLNPVKDDEEIIGISINALDITDYIKSQKEKELREANLKSLIQNTYDPMWSIDKQFRLIAFNSAYEDLASQYLGRPPVMGDSVLFETYSDELEELWEKSYERALKGERFEEEMVFNYVGGNIYLENEFNPIKNSIGEIIGVTCFSRDVTERRQQEEKNKEYASIVKFSNDAIIGFKIDGSIESWNPSAEDTFGYKAYEIIGKHTSELFTEKEFHQINQKFVSYLKGAPVEQFNGKMKVKSGELIDISLSFSLHRDKDGKVTKASAIIRDVSEQVKAERELIEQQHFIESITETSPSILYVYDFYQSKTIYINRRASEILGYPKEEIRGFEQGIYEIIHPEDKKHLIARNKELLHSEGGLIIDQEYRVKHKDGHYLWLNARNTIFKRNSDGRVLQILGTARDITEQKKIASEIEMLSLFAKHTLNYVVISNRNLEVEYVNESFEQQTGYSLQEVKGKVIEELLKGPKTSNTVLELIKKRKSENKPVNTEAIFYRKNGEPYWAASYINPVFDSDGNLKQYIQIQIDITDRKKNEELTIQAKELAERNAKFKDEFLANMSHEIRTPLNGIIGMIDILESTPLNNDQNHYIDTLKKSSSSLLEIINNILDLSKLEAGKMELKPINFELSKTLENVKQLYTPIAKQKNIKLVVETSDDVPEFIHSDENKLVQIVSNLLSNSIKFTEKGSVTISVSKKKGKNQLLFEVKDTGIGIDEENLNKLFEKFSQLDQSSGKRFAGTGLGLAITRELSALFGGKIGVSSKLGEGSNFWFTISYQEAKDIESLKRKRKQKEKSENKNFNLGVLLVDDKFINREVAALMLEQLGCTIDHAENGQQALENFNPTKHQLVFMDIQMPVMDGVEATQALRKKYANLPPIIALSANVMEGDAEKYINAGLDDYLPKPITKESVYQTLEKWFGNEKHTPKKTEKSDLTQEQIPVLKTEILESLKNMGSEEVLINLFQSFLKDADELIGEINKYLSEKNLEELRKSNHTINGLSGTIGASKVNKTCIEISKAAKDENLELLNKHVDKLNENYQELKEHIHKEVLNQTNFAS